jgi:two-component system, NtrC family, response regulator AtoC
LTSLPTVLIVEDEIVLAMELEEKLTEMGYSVVARVTSGEDALESAERLKPDLILMDIRLDDELDGIDAARLIRTKQHVPIVYLTAYADSKTLQRAKLTEPFGYLVKPYSERELHITIDMALHKAEMEKKLRESEERFRALFDTAEDLVFVKDRLLRYTHINPAMLKLIGVSLSEVIGKTDEELFGPREAEHSQEVEQRVLAGQTVELEHTLSLQGCPFVCNCIRVPLRDSAGRISGLCGIGRDITDRKGRERETVSLTDGEANLGEQIVSPAMTTTLHHVRLAAKVDSICLFLGESGSGKDWLARYLHDHSPRASGPFFCINCAALAPELAESELFGHEKGAFTGAAGRKRGLLELAEGGTLLLNEIGELSPGLQSKLLTFLDTKSFTRVGAEKNIFVNARLVAATNRNIEREVEAGTFRKDLFYRISVLTIRVPPLRERKEDLPFLVRNLTESLAKLMGLKALPVIDSNAMALLARYDWPGNVRELRNVLERAIIHSNGQRITPEQITLDSKLSATGSDSSISLRVDLTWGSSLNDALNEAKRSLVLEGLRRCGGSVTEAARVLGVSRDALNYIMKSLHIRRQDQG